jgi:murein DD-endopeptidase MepM/ murein hydrolase activator NlpD
MRRSRRLAAVLVSVIAPDAWAITAPRSIVSVVADERSCGAPKSHDVFQPAERQAFFWFLARDVRSGDKLRVEWIDPAGNVANTAEYGELSRAPAACFITQLPIAGFAPASLPGTWTVRAIANGAVAASRQFRIASESISGGPRISGVARAPLADGAFDLEVRGVGFEADAVVHIAEYTRTGGWRYLATLLPSAPSPGRLTVRHTGLPAGGYLAIVQNPDKRVSQPAPFNIDTGGGYKLPFAAGEPWMLTQGAYGSFSHWGNSLYAYDIAPLSGRCVAAMRAGIAYINDRGMGQNQRTRSFGNYITVDHGDGEYSHYAHLAPGTFVVKNGQRVEQGQALATVGNSGYTLGEGGGYHVHVHVTRAFPIASQSVPFRFDDLAAPRAGTRVVSSNASAWCNCRRAPPGMLAATGPAVGGAPLAKAAPSQFTGAVEVEQWWSQVVSVNRRAKSFEVTLSWRDNSADLDLHLVSPSGRHFGWYGETSGYSGSGANPERFRVARPEAGVWRVSVQGRKGGPQPIAFAVDTNGVLRR